MEGNLLCVGVRKYFASIDSPDGREARGSAGAAVQPIKFAQFRKIEINVFQELSLVACSTLV